MRHLGCFATIALGLLAAATPAAAAQSAGGESRLLWQIGTADNAAAEFALAATGFTGFNRDGEFIVGKSTPRRDWPYCHPGPADLWAGGSPHTFSKIL